MEDQQNGYIYEIASPRWSWAWSIIGTRPSSVWHHGDDAEKAQLVRVGFRRGT